ncbi:lactate racemase domain-containing protein [Paenibacillus sp. BSR1-1]|uniref:lactate racemase domain-containing protein n=1 Tax=Paenibacillus sp. BSR1-1 TaxID=3020845 RepID=UPI0025B027F8|nr:lactate racemase domain-containing protein [Paenibacillus sp. BSR1-1]MDN3019737.1 lactate racemase domain-containing protein [Paenibacillus sp. BSR1-1]
MAFPKMAKIRQNFVVESLKDISGTISEQFNHVNADEKIKPGMEIAITVGSRGINNIPLIVKSVADEIKKRGATPFIIPAMGSHGGATAEGQKEMVESLGCTEEFTGCEIRSSMDVVEVGVTSAGIPVYVDKIAYNADGIIVMGRVKPHTDFKNKIESGVLKMASIGMGKHKQALALHTYGIYGISEMMPEVGKVAIAKSNTLFGVAIVENAHEETAIIEAIEPEQIEERERELLKKAFNLMPSLPVDEIDILVVDEIGKNFSGTGMDTNIIGRIRVLGVEEPKKPSIKYVIASNLSEVSHGNALGIGLADLTTKRLFEKIDLKTMNENVVTSTFLARASIPIVLDNDQEALKAALRATWGVASEEARIVRIPNTLHIGELYVSEVIFSELKDKENIEVLEDLQEMKFDADGYFLSL